jgi:transcriptional regulator with XRE-family HTH domain
MANTLTHTLPITLQQARKTSRLSQLELSLRVGVSQRHVSFVESGRAKPSRELLINWLHELNAPLALRNAAMLQAGYAPVFGSAALGDPALAQANQAVVHLLRAHDPMPAYVLDAHWNLLHANAGGKWLAVTLMPFLQPAFDNGVPLNLLDALCHPEGMTKNLLNLEEVGPSVLAHLRDDASVLPALMPKVELFAALLRERLGAQHLHAGWPRQSAPVLTSRLRTAHGELSFFSMFTTFGTPQDITLASLRVEHMFAADAATRLVLEKQVLMPGAAL